jgi:predicted nuclease of restriction endonuclease-like (RecB) superfamily
MAKKRTGASLPSSSELPPGYDEVLTGISELLDRARHAAAQAVNSLLTASYWEVGRRIVELEQRGQARAAYGEALLRRLALDLSTRHGRGFSERNLLKMRTFYLGWEIPPTLSAELTDQGKGSAFAKVGATPEGKTLPQPRTLPSEFLELVKAFPLSWSHYVRLMSVDNLNARAFYEAEALRGGWNVRQLDRQIGSQFYERTALSRNKAAMLTKGQKPQSGDATTPEEELKDPFVLEFLGLKDEYSESELEEALIQHLESFLLELGNDFAFVGRQKRLRVTSGIGSTWSSSTAD